MVRVPINGTELEVEVLGPEGAPVIIAHHGGPGMSSRAEPKASFGGLADAYRVLVFDARGSGASGLDGPFTHEQWAADVDALRAWIGVEQIIVAGGSYGGFISLEYALRYPDRVRAIVLRDTAPSGAHQEDARRNALSSDRTQVNVATYERMMRGELTSDDDFRAAYRGIMPLYGATFDPDEDLTPKLAAIPFHHATHNAAFAENLPAYDVIDRLPTIAVPVLITVGRHDWITPVAQSELIAQGILGSELVIFEHSGHSPQVEERDLWLATIRDFLQRRLG